MAAIVAACVAADVFVLRARPPASEMKAGSALPESPPRTPPIDIAHGGRAQGDVDPRAPASSEIVQGLVQSTDGNALAGATVCWARDAVECCVPDACTVTGAQGQFRLVKGRGAASMVMASARGFAVGYERVSDVADEGRMTISLSPSSGEAVSGRVLDATGGAVAGALVTARSASGRFDVSAAVESDADGWFFLQVSPGWTVVMARSEAYSTAFQRVFAPARDVTLVMAPASGIAGSVVRADTDEPVENARVVLENLNGLLSQPQIVSTARDGSFRAEGLTAGGYTVSVGGGGWRSQAEWVTVGVGETKENVELRALTGTDILGVISIGQRPCPNAHVIWIGPEPFFTSEDIVGADAAGAVQINALPAGIYEVSVHCAPWQLQEEIVVGTSPVMRRWEFEPGLVLTGSVRRANGQPMPGAIVLIQPVEGPEDAPPSRADSGLTAPIRGNMECRAGQDGEFRCEGLAPGEYDCANVGLGTSDSKVRVRLDAGSKPHIVLEAPPESTIHVVPLGVGPIPGSLPVLAVGSGLPRPVRAEQSASGYSFEHMPLGEYTVYIGSDPSRSQSRKDVHLTRDGERVEIELAIPGTQTIAGRVMDEAGSPVLEAWVRAQDAAGLGSSATSASAPVLTDESGAFVIEHVLDGSYDLHVTSSQGETSVPAVRAGSSGLLIRLKSTERILGSSAPTTAEPANGSR